MFFAQRLREMSNRTNRMANIKLACNADKDEFAKNVSIRDTFLRDILLCFWCLLMWTFESQQMVGYCVLHGNGCGTVMFVGGRGIPFMCLGRQSMHDLQLSLT